MTMRHELFRTCCRHAPLGHNPTPGLRLMRMLSLACGLCMFGIAGASGSPLKAVVPPDQAEDFRMWMGVGDHRFSVTLADTEAAQAFTALLPYTVDMSDLNSNEKYAELPRALPAKASRPGTIHNGELMLYGTKTLVVFYLTFSSPYSYTPLGWIDDPAALARVIGQGDVRIRFSAD